MLRWVKVDMKFGTPQREDWSNSVRKKIQYMVPAPITQGLYIAPGDHPYRIIRNQIDFIVIDKRFRNHINRVAAYPEANTSSDHSPK